MKKTRKAKRSEFKFYLKFNNLLFIFIEYVQNMIVEKFEEANL